MLQELGLSPHQGYGIGLDMVPVMYLTSEQKHYGNLNLQDLDLSLRMARAVDLVESAKQKLHEKVV